MTRPSSLSIVRGTLDVLVMRAISWQPLHGFEISLWLDERTDGQLVIDDSALYQALHRLEAKRLVTGEWGTSDNNRRARYYRLTTAGRQQLAAETREMVAYAKTLTHLLTTAARP
jgi:transcriptional regulator